MTTPQNPQPNHHQPNHHQPDQPQPSQGQSQAGNAYGQQPDNKKSATDWLKTIGTLVVLAVVIGGILFYMNRDNSSTDEPLADGTCIKDIGFVSMDTPDEITRDCDSPEADAVILASVDPKSDKKCIDVPGATNTFETSLTEDGDTHEFTYCIGDVGANPENAANTLEKGDCLTIPEDDEQAARKAECGSPDSQLIVGRVDNKKPEGGIMGMGQPHYQPDGSVTFSSNFCKDNGFPDATEEYTMNIPTGTENSDSPESYRTFCLVNS